MTNDRRSEGMCAVRDTTNLPRQVTRRQRDRLRSLLRRYNDRPAEREAIVAELERDFHQALAVLVLDTCGFSRTVHANGIVPFLATLQRLSDIARPCILSCGGRVLRVEADNIFALFATPSEAVVGAVTILDALTAANKERPEDDRIYVSMGIGYGDLLVIANDDLYGDEMNLACKLGEDLAQEDEVLLTPAAWRALGPCEWSFETVDFSISGLELTAHRFVR